MFALTAMALSLDLPAAVPWLAMSVATLGTLIPSSPGHIGTFDFFALEAVIAYGAQRDLAAAFALLVHVILWLPITLAGGLYILLWWRLRQSTSPPAP